MPRILQIARKKSFIGCLMPCSININGLGADTVSNGEIYYCCIDCQKDTSVQVTIGSKSKRFEISAGEQNVAFLLSQKYSFLHGVDCTLNAQEYIPLIKVHLSSISEIDQVGIFFNDTEGTSHNISYCEAYKGWRQNKKCGRTKPWYICDQINNGEERQFIFYTDPRIIFYTDSSDKESVLNFASNLRQLGYFTFDNE